MTRQERATQIWPILVLCASKRQLLTYDELSRLIGVPLPGLGQLLEPIQAYCLRRKIPALTSIVVRRTDGMPGEGFIAAENVPLAQAEVFSYDWSQQNCPVPEDFNVGA
jgi:hypothetical protein